MPVARPAEIAGVRTLSETHMDRAMYTKLWNDAWTEGLWAASWEKSLADLTP